MTKLGNSQMMAVLYLELPDGSSKAFKLRNDATIFGRDKGDIQLQDKEVSSTHCQIQSVNGNFHIFDMNSTNGTWVNQERVVRKKLESGDIISIGRIVMRFVMEEEKIAKNIPSVMKNNVQSRDDTRMTLVETLIENDASRQARPKLLIEVSYRNGESESLQLSQEVVYIDRTSTFGRFDSDPELSRRHLKIKISNTGQVFIEDQGSTNGVYLNGNKISGLVPVVPEDQVRIGGATLRLSLKKQNS